jgi:phosphoserine phosphatase
MLKAASLGIAYHAKPAVAAEATNRVQYGSLVALLFAQGYTRADFITAP